MKTTRIIAAVLIVLGLTLLLSIPALAADGARKPSIVLVHGAFADGSSWAKVIPILQARGYKVTAVQIRVDIGPGTTFPKHQHPARRSFMFSRAR